jgi:hypothetical protein
MTQIIYKYLSRNFYIKHNQVFSFQNSIPKSCRWLINDLVNIFGFTKKQLKWYLKGWLKKNSKSFDFEKYWNSCIEHIVFPKVLMLQPELISPDLINVPPIEPDLISDNFQQRNLISSRYSSRKVNYNFYRTLNIRC